MLRRRHIFLDSYFCPVCIEFVEETISHLFFDCPFSQACWTFLGISWDFDIPFLDMIIQARQAFASISFREVVMIAYWIYFFDDLKWVTLRAGPLLGEKLNCFMSSLC
ncbi:hypothetical protein PAHAL_5G286300 [Panicum hallii]|uniref:Reverse transcriptase zinc-binding domain-containing protein n=1 Tax=Panicum hallii TaxID=206008 RepID=A0A2T8ILJ1_9POAL|nr:hypothetical protein PAHAL_5G286300 [Panicum hallii]